ncbi:AEC family transporter [Holophaga foetida]|uniref:AEC family transporter n=1 Tax=Holophaga foetida TaxID=35839 RepID=UPI0002474CF6|nr:AEC family transporter [Holophaga foetida]
MNQLIFTQVLTLFILMGVGLAARRLGQFTPEVSRGMSAFLMNFCMPMMVLSSFLRPFNMGMLATAGRMLGYALAIHLLLVMLAWIIFRKAPAAKRPGLQFITVFSNSGFMGLPLLAMLFPIGGVFFGAVYSIAFTVFMFTAGVAFFSPGNSRPSPRQLFLNPVILSTLAGIACFLASVKLPTPIMNTLGIIGGMTSPLSMLIIGAMLGDMKLRDILGSPVEYLLCAVRLLVAPLLTLLLCRMLHVDPVLEKILVILQALPAATIVAAFAEKYGSDRAFVSRCTFLSTLLSILTIPLVVKILERFGG